MKIFFINLLFGIGSYYFLFYVSFQVFQGDSFFGPLNPTHAILFFILIVGYLVTHFLVNSFMLKKDTYRYGTSFWLMFLTYIIIFPLTDAISQIIF